MSCDGVTLAVGTTDGRVLIHDLREAKQPVTTLAAHSTSVRCVAFQQLPLTWKSASDSSLKLSTQNSLSRSNDLDSSLKITQSDFSRSFSASMADSSYSQVFSPLRDGVFSPLTDSLGDSTGSPFIGLSPLVSDCVIGQQSGKTYTRPESTSREGSSGQFPMPQPYHVSYNQLARSKLKHSTSDRSPSMVPVCMARDGRGEAATNCKKLGWNIHHPCPVQNGLVNSTDLTISTTDNDVSMTKLKLTDNRTLNCERKPLDSTILDPIYSESFEKQPDVDSKDSKTKHFLSVESEILGIDYTANGSDQSVMIDNKSSNHMTDRTKLTPQNLHNTPASLVTSDPSVNGPVNGEIIHAEPHTNTTTSNNITLSSVTAADPPQLRALHRKLESLDERMEDVRDEMRQYSLGLFKAMIDMMDEQKRYFENCMRYYSLNGELVAENDRLRAEIARLKCHY